MRDNYTCAMCGNSVGGTAPYSAITVPPAALGTMQNSEEIDTDSLVGKVSVYLCKDDAKLAKRMVNKYETSPIPECDVGAVQYETRANLEAEVGHEVDLTMRMLADALDTVSAAESGQANHLSAAAVFEAKAVVLTLQLLDRSDLPIQ